MDTYLAAIAVLLAKDYPYFFPEVSDRHLYMFRETEFGNYGRFSNTFSTVVIIGAHRIAACVDRGEFDSVDQPAVDERPERRWSSGDVIARLHGFGPVDGHPAPLS